METHIDGKVWHLDFDSSPPGTIVCFKGLGYSLIKAVRQLGSKRCETVQSIRCGRPTLL
uniref:Uncharacterized protein n=1 Tax=Kalanchoe fedtschenkoi TaxID=63787 RepID=A0A7N0T1C6_KALFE